MRRVVLLSLLPLVAVAAVVAVASWSLGAWAHTPDPEVDFSIGVDPTSKGGSDTDPSNDICSTNAVGPTKCNIPAQTFTVNFYLMRRYSPSVMISFNFVSPVFGVLISVLLLGEQLSGHVAAGVAAVGLGLFLITWR